MSASMIKTGGIWWEGWLGSKTKSILEHSPQLYNEPSSYESFSGAIFHRKQIEKSTTKYNVVIFIFKPHSFSKTTYGGLHTKY